MLILGNEALSVCQPAVADVARKNIITDPMDLHISHDRNS